MPSRNIVLSHYSEALRSIKIEIDKLRDEFNSSQALSPDRESNPAEGVMPKHAYGSPMKGKYAYPLHINFSLLNVSHF